LEICLGTTIFGKELCWSTSEEERSKFLMHMLMLAEILSKNMVQSLEASLKRLNMNYIDLYWVHA
jgi:diketogulonate reductase-like aldo/keto reductase